MEELLKLLGTGGTMAADAIEPTGILSGGINALTNILTGNAGKQSMGLAQQADDMKNRDYLNYGFTNQAGTVGQQATAEQFKTQNNAPRNSAEAVSEANRLNSLGENEIARANQNVLGAKTTALQNEGDMRRSTADALKAQGGGAGAMAEIAGKLGEGSAAGGQQILSQGGQELNQAYQGAGSLTGEASNVLGRDTAERQNELMSKYGVKAGGYSAGESPLIGSSYGENLSLGASQADKLGGMTKSLLGGHAGQLDAYKLFTDWIAGKEGGKGVVNGEDTSTGGQVDESWTGIPMANQPHFIEAVPMDSSNMGSLDFGKGIMDMAKPGYKFNFGNPPQQEDQLDLMLKKKVKNTLPWYKHR